MLSLRNAWGGIVLNVRSVKAMRSSLVSSPMWIVLACIQFVPLGVRTIPPQLRKVAPVGNRHLQSAQVSPRVPSVELIVVADLVLGSCRKSAWRGLIAVGYWCDQ